MSGIINTLDEFEYIMAIVFSYGAYGYLCLIIRPTVFHLVTITFKLLL